MRQALMIFALTLAGPAFATGFQPACHNSPGKAGEPGQVRGGGLGTGTGTGTSTGTGTGTTGAPSSGSGGMVSIGLDPGMPSGGSSGSPSNGIVNPGAPDVILPGTSGDNGTDRIVGSAGGGEGYGVTVPESTRAKLKNQRARGNSRLHAHMKRAARTKTPSTALDRYIAASNTAIMSAQTIEQTVSFKDEIRAPASVSTSYEPASVNTAGSAR